MMQKNNTTIKNLLFDIGGVLLSYRWSDALSKHGYSEEEARRVVKELQSSPFWDMMDLGVLTYKEIVEKASLVFPEDAEMIKAFYEHCGAEIRDYRPRVWEKVSALRKKGYKVYYLSNYSKEMTDEHLPGCTFLDDSDGVIISFHIHMVKPEKRIFEYTLKHFGIAPEETLFFDDRADNCESAASLGINVINVTGEDFLLGKLDELLNE